MHPPRTRSIDLHPFREYSRDVYVEKRFLERGNGRKNKGTRSNAKGEEGSNKSFVSVYLRSRWKETGGREGIAGEDEGGPTSSADGDLALSK